MNSWCQCQFACPHWADAFATTCKGAHGIFHLTSCVEGTGFLAEAVYAVDPPNTWKQGLKALLCSIHCSINSKLPLSSVCSSLVSNFGVALVSWPSPSPCGTCTNAVQTLQVAKHHSLWAASQIIVLMAIVSRRPSGPKTTTLMPRLAVKVSTTYLKARYRKAMHHNEQNRHAIWQMHN